MQYSPYIAGKDKSIFHIDFVIPEDFTNKKRQAFVNNLNQEINLCVTDLKTRDNLKGLPLAERCDSVRELAKMQQKFLDTQKSLDRNETARKGAALFVEDAIPCSLHAENRINEHLIYRLFCHAIHRYSSDSPGDVTKRKSLIDDITECMRTQVFGDPEKGYVYKQWTFPAADGKKVEKKALTDSKACTTVSGLARVAEIAFATKYDQGGGNSDAIRKTNLNLLASWKKLATTYTELVEMLRCHDDFSEPEIKAFHKCCNTFMDTWVNGIVEGNDGITNYIHMIGAGHFTYYLRKYKNLYRYCQQGWEALNQKGKHYYFNNTNHGSSFGNSTNATIGNHMQPVMAMYQRFTMWRLGFGRVFFLYGGQETVVVYMKKYGDALPPQILELPTRTLPADMHVHHQDETAE